ncbi:MAG: 50S ribosomal protein L3 [Planctomycetes bacterium]|nr:50S ribosomal protein L3 [Planctomycetota bacterium]
MVTRLLGRKVGMTQIYTDKGKCIGVTVLEAGPCTVLQVKTKERDGYTALQLAFGSRKRRNVARAELGHLIPKTEGQSQDDRRKAVQTELKKIEPPCLVTEVPWDGKEAVKVGDKITCAIFEGWKKIDVVGLSKGRGFMGVVRRWGFHGLPATHGQSDRERAPGSLGRQHSISQGVHPGKRMAGHWGQERVTMRNLELVKVNKDRNLVFVQGAVPGANGDLVVLKEAHWTAPKPPTVTSKKQKAAAGKK